MCGKQRSVAYDQRRVPGNKRSNRISQHMDNVMISSLSAEQVNDEETVARAGDSGPSHDSQEADPWLTGEIEQLKTKWLQKELKSSYREASQEGKETASLESFPRIRSSRSSRHNSARDYVIEIGQDALKRESERVHEKELAVSPLSDTPLVSEFTSMRLSDSQISPPRLSKNFQHKNERLHNRLEYFSILAYLAFFGIIGVLIRYGLEVLFYDVLSVTREGTILYTDLPANVVGSFFMGWVGIVFKKEILLLSEPLAIGLSTGLMGSITTYAGWNQKMVDLLTTGDVGAALSGLLLGMAIAQMSLLAGIDSARGLKLATAAKLRWDQTQHDLENAGKQSPVNLHVSLAVIAFATTCLWGAALVLLIRGHSSQSLNILWLACLVAPPGVWTRWHLARFNGKGVGGRLKWLPVGTLLANLIGASLRAVLGLLQYVVTNHNAPLFIGGLQLGFLGCLTTVSTFAAEVYTMHVGPMRLKAYIYTILTLGLGLVLGALLFSAPALTLGYVKW